MTPDKICGEFYEHDSGFVEVCNLPVHNPLTLFHGAVRAWRPATRKESDWWKKSGLQRATIHDMDPFGGANVLSRLRNKHTS